MAKTRVTRRTDSHGRVKEGYLGSFEQKHLAAARTAGIPESLLDSAGSDDWRSTGKVIGLWAEWVYVLADCLRGVDALDNERRDNLRIVEEVFAVMLKVVKGLGIDPEAPDLIPWDVWEVRRELSPLARAGERMPGEVEAAEEARASMEAEYAAAMDVWGAPSGPEHDSHGHGLANGSWHCMPEEPE